MTALKFASLTLLLLCFCATGYAVDEQATISSFSALYAKFKAAMNSRDTKVVGAMLAPKFQSEDVSGKAQSAEQMLAGLTSLPQDPNKKSQTTVVSVELSGATAKVVQRYHMTTIKAVADDQVQTIEITAVSDDTWSQMDGSWKLLRTVTRQMDYSADGRLLAHKIHASD